MHKNKIKTFRNINKYSSPFKQANIIQKKVASIGFDYPTKEDSLKKVIEEVKELRFEIKKNNKEKIIEELGDLIFSCLDVSRKLNLNPKIILEKANKKFLKRWNKVEKLIEENNKNIKDLNIDDFEYFWQKAKKK
jgi:phosphoribosyl-ATP pyrophosphohydrolase|tara:strand:+ start:422 stop:826 length:405 start_codon:yes stop_codon:yes gene_type:complete